MVYYARGIGKYRDSIGKREGGGSGGGGLDGITEIWTMRCRSVGSKIGASVRLNGRESKWPLTTATRSERRQTGVSPRSVSRRNWTREGHFVTVATRYPSLPPSLFRHAGRHGGGKKEKKDGKSRRFQRLFSIRHAACTRATR